MTITGQKALLKSTTIQGAAIAGLPAIDALLVQLGLIDAPIFSTAFAGVVSAVGALIAIWGRVKAKKIVKLF